MNADPTRVAAWAGGIWDPTPPTRPLTGVSQDSRRLQAGDLYVALRGEVHDGHAFVADAVRAGAAAALVVSDYQPPAGMTLPLLRVSDPSRALLALAAGYRASLPVDVIGVTGSVGKTTVKEMVAALLAGAAGGRPVAATPGNWNNAVGLPLSLLQMAPDARYGVFEIGTNHPGEIAPLARCLQPRVGVVTTIGPVHIEHFGSTEAIAREKAELLRALPANGLAVLDQDHAAVPLLRDAAPCRVVTVSMAPSSGADYRGLEVTALPDGMQACTLVDPTGQRRTLTAPFRGRHQAANLLLAAAVARELGAGWDAIQAASRSIVPPAMRWQRLSHDGVLIINDAYNANPVSMRAALETFAAESAPSGRRWLVLGGMRELGGHGPEEHRILGRLASSHGWEGLVTVGDLAAGIADGAREAGFPEQRVVACADPAAAAAVLRARLQPGDAILIKASRAERLETLLDALGMVQAPDRKER